MKVKNDHRSKFSNLSNWKEEVWKISGLQLSCFNSVGRALHWYHGGHGFESRWSPDIFQASSFQLLKSENLLRGSFFTFFSPTLWRYLFTVEIYPFDITEPDQDQILVIHFRTIDITSSLVLETNFSFSKLLQCFLYE